MRIKGSRNWPFEYTIYVFKRLEIFVLVEQDFLFSLRLPREETLEREGSFRLTPDMPRHGRTHSNTSGLSILRFLSRSIRKVYQKHTAKIESLKNELHNCDSLER